LLQLALVPLVSADFLTWVAFKSVPGLGGWNGLRSLGGSLGW
jgi:hypothetical protein